MNEDFEIKDLVVSLGGASGFFLVTVTSPTAEFVVYLDRMTPNGTYPIKITALDSSGGQVS